MKNSTNIQLPEFIDEQQSILNFLEIAKNKPELDRINLAKKLWSLWKKLELKTKLFPGVPERNDFWFLTQVLAQSQLFTMKKKPSQFLYLSKKIELLNIEKQNLSENEISSLHKKGFNLPTFQEVLILNQLGIIKSSKKIILLSQQRIEPLARPLQLFCNHKNLGGSQYIDGVPIDKSYKIKPIYLIKTIKS